MHGGKRSRAIAGLDQTTCLDRRPHLRTCRRGRIVDMNRPKTFFRAGFRPHRETAIIIHGFNGTQTSRHIMFLKDGLDPARPLIEKHASNRFRLTKDDAKVVQIIHTNAGFLGQSSFTGTIDFCINGGQTQPYCSGDSISKYDATVGVVEFDELLNLSTERARCSHFLSVCYLANAVLSGEPTVAFPCPTGCVRNNRIPFAPLRYSSRIRGRMKYYHIGEDTPEEATGGYCVHMDQAMNCPYN
ncbi:hypothetical protein RP20_CCG017101 [Aedes albopictus]|nr:hypothetical protein RP20_CCG017101 [Aedes albopictus]